MNHSTRYVMTARSDVVRSVDHQPNLNEGPPNSAAYFIDFFEARHRLLTESERIAHEREMDRQIQESDRQLGRRTRPLGQKMACRHNSRVSSHYLELGT